jgi:hypothetical protein
LSDRHHGKISQECSGSVFFVPLPLHTTYQQGQGNITSHHDNEESVFSLLIGIDATLVCHLKSNAHNSYLYHRITAQSLICSTSSSALAPGASVCCYNASVTFKQLEIYATSEDMNGMSGCLTISWSCGSCVSNTGRVCQSDYSYQCSVPQQAVYCSICAYNSNLVFTEQVSLQVDAY